MRKNTTRKYKRINKILLIINITLSHYKFNFSKVAKNEIAHGRFQVVAPIKSTIHN